MKRSIILMLLTVILFGFNGGVLYAQDSYTGESPRTLVFAGLGEIDMAIARLEAHEWEIDIASSEEVLEARMAPLEMFDVVWIQAATNSSALESLTSDSGPVSMFVRDGGVAVIMDVSPEEYWQWVAPGGMSAMAQFGDESLPLYISAPNHPLISGIDIGGQKLSEANLDPYATGGRCAIVSHPHDKSPCTVIALSIAGPVVLDHSYGLGRVLISSLENPDEVYMNNLMLYVQSVVEERQ
jgi:hypothetical protein